MLAGCGVCIAGARRYHGQMRSNVARILRAGLVTGVVDGLWACVLAVGFYGSTFTRLWQAWPRCCPGKRRSAAAPERPRPAWSCTWRGSGVIRALRAAGRVFTRRVDAPTRALRAPEPVTAQSPRTLLLETLPHRPCLCGSAASCRRPWLPSSARRPLCHPR